MISTANEHKLHKGNGSTTVFPYDFKIFEDADLEVIVADANDKQTTLTLNTHYTVSGAGEDTGGNVTSLDLTAICGSTNLPTGWVISIRRVLDLLQETDFNNQGGFYPETHEDQFDKVVSMIQQQQNELDRCPKVTSTSGDTGDVFFETIETMISDGQAGINATLGQAEVARDAAIAAQGLAETAQAAAELAQTNAETAETNAETAESNAAQSAIDAAASVAAAGLPASLVGHGGEVLRVKGDETGYEFDSNITPQIQTGDAGKEVVVKADESGYELVAKKVEIQDYTVVGNVGDASQFMAGYTGWTIAELEHFFGAGKIYSYHKFATGALGTDETGTYPYTMGAAAKAPSDGVGIEGVAGTAISFDGGDYAVSDTANSKLDNMTTIFSGTGKGFVHSFWISSPTDGQPAASSMIFKKLNTVANDAYYVYLSTSGNIVFNTRGNSASTKYIFSTTTLPNGANTIWTHIVTCWDTTYGIRLFVNGINEGTDSTATTLMIDGTTADFFIGGSDATPTDPFTGRIAQEIIINKVAEQRDIDILFATTRPEPAALTGKTYTVTDFVRPEADTNYEIQGEAQVLAKYGNKIWLQGRQYGESDTVKLIGSVM